jgi:hypothetical protein
MSEIGHSEIKAFAAERVNLPKAKADEYRAQVRALRERLDKKIADDPNFDLVKMLHSGSVAKGTALRTINDLDVAVYVKVGTAPTEDSQLIPWLIARLREANPTLVESQFLKQDHSVKVTFKGSGLDVDVAPVLFEGDANDYGVLIRKDGQRVSTSIPRHLEFIRSRKTLYGDDFAQLIRLTKWWKNVEWTRDSDFRMKSFLIELVWAHLAAKGVALDDYPEALTSFFSYLVQSTLSERISFDDYYAAAKLPGPSGAAAIEVFDPVNPENNVAVNYSSSDRQRIVNAAQNAFDALGDGKWATTKADAIECWQEILGPSFRG